MIITVALIVIRLVIMMTMLLTMMIMTARHPPGDPLGPFPTDYSPQFPNPNSLPQARTPSGAGHVSDRAGRGRVVSWQSHSIH